MAEIRERLTALAEPYGARGGLKAMLADWFKPTDPIEIHDRPGGEFVSHAPADMAALLQVLEDVKAALTEGRHHPGTRADMAFAALARFDADWLNGREADRVVSERDELREQLAAMTRERDRWKRTAEQRSTVAAAARCIALEDQLRVAAEEAEYLRQWSNDLAALVPEGDEATYSDPEGAQESILLDVFTAYARERDALKARLDAVRAFHHKWGETPSPDDLDQMDLWTDLGHILTRQEGAADD